MSLVSSTLLFNQKKKSPFPHMSFLFVLLFFFYSKKKKSSACLCLLWKQNKPFFKWFSLAFSRTDLDSINDPNEFLLPIVSTAAAVLFYRSDSGLRHCRSTAATPTLAQSCRRPHQLCTIWSPSHPCFTSHGGSTPPSPPLAICTTSSP